MTHDMLSERIRSLIVDVPDFPKPGVVFKDITPVFADGPTNRALADFFADRYRPHGLDAVVAIESRGFLVGALIAASLGIGLILVRKPNKLPRATHALSYDLEYGQDTLEIHQDAVHDGMKVVVVDDLLATGGTARATCDLVQKNGASVLEASFLVELGFLSGRDRLGDIASFSVLTY